MLRLVLLNFAVVTALNLFVPAVHGGDAKCDGLTAAIVGTDGDDDLIGTPGNDVIVGGAGNDSNQGGDGNDELYQYANDTELQGNRGDDLLVNWNDTAPLTGETVTMEGGRGDDTLLNEDSSGTTDQDGGRVFDGRTGGTTATDC